MKKYCTWCGEYLGEVEGRPDQADQVSHGICKKCRWEEFPSGWATGKDKARNLLGVIRQATVPGGAQWQCVKCQRRLPPGEVVAKKGKEVYCTSCVRRQGL